MTQYPRFSIEERRKLTMSRRATESFRTIGIRGGADPSQGTPTSTPDYYDLSEEDRATFEATMNMTHDNNILKQTTARQALTQAMKGFSPVAQGALAALYNTSIGGIPIGGVAEASWMALRFAGLLTETEWEIPDSEGFCSDGDTQAIGVNSVDIQGGSYTVEGGQARNLKPGAGAETITPSPDAPEFGAITYSVDISNTGCRPVICKNGAVIHELGGCGHASATTPGCPEAFIFEDGTLHACDEEGYWLQVVYDILRNQMEGESECLGSWSLEGTVSDYTEGDEITMGFRDPDGSVRCDVLGNGLYDTPTPALGGMDPVPSTDLPITDIPLDELCDMIDDLQNNPDLAPYLPAPGDPFETLPDPGGTPPIDPGTGLPPGTVPDQPVDPGANPGPGEPIPDVPGDPGLPIDPSVPPGDPSIPPVTPGVPPGPDTPITDPIDSGIEDPLDGGCNTLAGEPSGFRDPKQPGGISRKFQPGQPVTIDYGSGSTCRVKITRVKPSKDLQTGEKGTEICVSPTLDNGGKTTEKTCYGPGPVTEAISSVLGGMIAEGGQVIFDSDCTRELQRPMCFRAGTSKRVILNKLLDMCGFCVFPMFDCNVIVGYCGPVNVHWTYHEDVDLMAFDVEYDNLETYDYIQVFRGDRMNQSGQILEPGGEVFYPVGAPASSVNGDRVFQHEVPYGTSQTDMLAIAMDLAAKYRQQAMPLVAFGVPLNSQLLLRHQIHFKRPSLGFNATYMVTRIVRDYDRENGHLSTGLARWLSGS